MPDEPIDYSWFTTKARCCICGGALAHEGGLGIHPARPDDPTRLTCQEKR